MLILSPKPLEKLTTTGKEAGRQTDRRTGAQDFKLSHYDALTKKDDDVKNTRQRGS